MPLQKILSFLTYPGKNRSDLVPLTGTEIPIDDGKLCSMLSDIFARSDTECDIPIIFKPEDGQQKNAVRSEIIHVVTEKSVESAAPLAARLQQVTSATSGMGLLFICIGEEQTAKKVVISRFPADEGVVAEKTANKLTVSFVEQVFLKSSFSYKAVAYKDESVLAGFWTGYVVDKQINHGSKAVAAYWIEDFLQSDFKTTSATGTKRLALALRKAASNTTDPVVKSEIASSVQLATNMPRKAATIESFCDHFHFSPATKEAIFHEVRPAKLIHEKFKFERAEFLRHISYKSIELDNGAVLTAQLQKFDDCFKTSPSKTNAGAYRFVTEGQIVDQRLRKTK
jgi:hypothetical protein